MELYDVTELYVFSERTSYIGLPPTIPLQQLLLNNGNVLDRLCTMMAENDLFSNLYGTLFEEKDPKLYGTL